MGDSGEFPILSEQNIQEEYKMSEPVLVVMAAGMGSRYGGLKQIDPVDEYGNKMVDYTERLNTAVGQAQEGYCTVLLSHRPEFFELYQKYDVDLVLCGHTHGGQWRIPYLLNGLVAPHQGFFPKYAGGRYDAENMTMIISRGLARETTKIPRVFNRPELVIVELE